MAEESGKVGTIWVELTLDGKKYTSELNAAKTQATKTATDLDSTMQKLTGVAASRMGFFGSELAGIMGKAAVAVGGVFLAVSSLEKAFATAEHGAREMRIDAQFAAATAAIGLNSEEFYKKMDSIFGGTLEDTRIKQQSTLMLARGMTEATIENTGKAAAAMARITGHSIDQEFTSLSQGIMIGFPRTLVRLGIITRQEMQAITFGFRSGLLTQEELSAIATQRAEAFLTRIGGATDDAQKEFARFHTAWKNLMDDLAKEVSIGVYPYLKDLVALLKWFTENREKFKPPIVEKEMQYRRQLGLAEPPGGTTGPQKVAMPMPEDVMGADKKAKTAAAMADQNKTMNELRAKEYATALNIARAENVVKNLQQDQLVAMEKLNVEKATYLANSEAYLPNLATEFTKNYDLAQLEKKRIQEETDWKVKELQATIAATDAKERETRTAVEQGKKKLDAQKELLQLQIDKSPYEAEKSRLGLQVENIERQKKEIENRAVMTEQERAKNNAKKEGITYEIESVKKAAEQKKLAIDQGVIEKQNSILAREAVKDIEERAKLIDEQLATEQQMNKVLQDQRFAQESSRLELESTIVDYKILMNQASELDKLTISASQKRLDFDKQIAAEVDKMDKAQLKIGDDMTDELREQLKQSIININAINEQRTSYEKVLSWLTRITEEQDRQQKISGRVGFWQEFISTTGAERVPELMQSMTDQLEIQIRLWRNWGIPDDAIQRMREVQELQNSITTGTASWGDALLGGLNKFSAGVSNLQISIQDLTSTTLNDFASGMANAFSETIKGSKSAKDAFRDFTTSFLQDVSRQIMQTMILLMVKKAAGLLMGTFGGGGINMGYEAWGGQSSPMIHSGGVAGEGRFPQRQVPSFMFAVAPKLHSGLMADEYPAILQRGERVIPKNKAQEPTSVNNLHLSVVVNAANAKFAGELQREIEDFTSKAVDRKIKEYS